jgi:hypothetical protein
VAVKPEMTSSVGAALCGRPVGRHQAACRNRAATQGAYGILRTAPTEKPVGSTLTAYWAVPRLDGFVLRESITLLPAPGVPFQNEV